MRNLASAVKAAKAFEEAMRQSTETFNSSPRQVANFRVALRSQQFKLAMAAYARRNPKLVITLDQVNDLLIPTK